MNIKALLVASVSASLVLGAGASAAQPVAAFEMEYVKRASDEVQKRAHSLGHILSGRPLRASESMRALARTTETTWHAPFADAPHILVRHVAEADEIRLLDEVGTRESFTGKGIDRDGALRVAAETMELLAREGFIDPRHYDMGRAEIGTHKIGGGSIQSKRPEFEQITEYRITLRPALNGIEVANAGVRLGVHASGKLVGLRVGGVTIKTLPVGKLDTPSGRGIQTARTVSDAELDRRFVATVGRGAERRLHWSRVMYVMPEGATRAVVAPTRLYAYSDAFKADGESAVGRRRITGFSIVDRNAAMSDHTPATRAAAAKKEGERLR